jgi:hypothetical protein
MDLTPREWGRNDQGNPWFGGGTVRVSVLRVSVKDNPTGSFLVEWYQPGLASAPPAETAARLAAGAAVARANGSAVSVLLTLSAPRDDTLFGVLCADTEETVQQVCRHAGCPPDRITGDIHTHLNTDEEPNTR